ncbi:MAG: hypothetical protein NT136_04095 [Candidatus Moranbacteria bacterium]|nr:hypothetical protein [Candidatus Moranbacteria bacterium]
MEDQGQSKGAQVRRIQLDLTILESDYRKNERELEDLRLELTKMKRQRSQLDLEIGEEEEKVKKLQNEQMILVDELKRLKHKMNLL